MPEPRTTAQEVAARALFEHDRRQRELGVSEYVWSQVRAEYFAQAEAVLSALQAVEVIDA